MLWTKRLFLAYLAVFGLLSIAALATLPFAPSRDPNTLYAGYGTNIRSLDPALSYDGTSSPILSHCYEPLYDFQYGQHPPVVIPLLAAAMPTISADKLTYTIPIRHGVHFQAAPGETGVFGNTTGLGPEVQAEDFIYSLKRVSDSLIASPAYSTFLQDKVVGLDDFFAASAAAQKAGKLTDYNLPVAGLTAVDPYTLRITLVRPCPQFIYGLAVVCTSAVCKHAVEYYGDKFGSHPVGTGPYCFKQHQAEYRVVLTASPSFRGRPDAAPETVPPGSKIPSVPTVVFDYFAESLPMWHAFNHGLYESMELPIDVYNKVIDVDKKELRPEYFDRGIRLRIQPEFTTYYYGFNLRDPLIGNNKPLRQAMSLAWDRESFIRKYLLGRGIQLQGILPPGFPLADRQPENPYNHFDLEKARELAKEAAKINGGTLPKLKLMFDGTDARIRQYAEAFKSSMAAIDLVIELDGTTFARQLERTDSRDFQVSMSAWQADYPDEQTFMQAYYSKLADPGGVNMFGYINPEFDKLYEQALPLPSCPERDALNIRMMALVNEACPTIQDYAPLRFYVHRSWLKNFEVPDYGNAPRAYQQIDIAARQAALRSGRY